MMESITTDSDIISIPLRNWTDLDEKQYTIYVLGFSTASRKMLYKARSEQIAKFVPVCDNEGTLPAYKLGEEIREININVKPTDLLNGARIYFFVANNTTFHDAPKVKYTNCGANVINVKNPPNTESPPYSYIEFTIVDLAHGAVIDIQTVDGLTFPLNLTVSDSSGVVCGAVGQPISVNKGFNRNAIFAAYKPFVNSIGPEAAPFLDLQYSENSGGLLNPGIYLTHTNENNELINLKSPLNSLFDSALKTLFSNRDLSIQGVASGGPNGIKPDVYTVNSIGDQPLPRGNFRHPALQFKGGKNGLVLNVFSPLGLCTLTFNNKGTATAICGRLDDTTLTFDTALPADTNILTGMYVSGAGVDPKTTTVKSITRDTSNNITGVVIYGTEKGKLPLSQYGFSKIPDMFMTSGAMVFANTGVFDYRGSYAGDEAIVVLNLQNQLVSALNRGVANMTNNDPGSMEEIGYSSQRWGTQTNWYPKDKDTAQNLFSLFMHTATVSVGTDKIPVFIQAPNSVKCARGTIMGQAYGFAYDENAGPVPPAPENQPDVPSKFDPLPHGVNVLTITLGAWS